VGAIIQSAQLGLEPDGLGARAYIIPRRNRRKPGTPLEANFQVGYQGLMELARRSKEIARFDVHEVYEGDSFSFAYGLKPALHHVPKGETNEAKITHVYAIGTLTNGHSQFEVMTRAQVEAHREKYSQDTREDSAWQTAWPQQAKKTVIIKVCKYLPASVELQTAIALAEHDEIGLPQDLGVVAQATNVQAAPKPASKLDALTETLGHAQAETPVADAPTAKPIRRRVLKDTPSGGEISPAAPDAMPAPAVEPVAAAPLAPPESSPAEPLDESEKAAATRGELIGALWAMLSEHAGGQQRRIMVALKHLTTAHFGAAKQLTELTSEQLIALLKLKREDVAKVFAEIGK